MAKDNKITKGINWSKARCVLVCKNYNAPRCVYLQYTVGNAPGPTKTHMTNLQQFIDENSYMCGDSVRVYSNGEMEAPALLVDEEEELPFFC